MTLAIDFGTCNTVLARWNSATRSVETLRPQGMSRIYRYRLPGAASERESAVIPSLVHYGEGNTLRTGAQVENAGLASHRGTFRWVKLDLLRDNNRARRINGDLITPRQAAEDLIGEVLLAAGAQAGEDLVVTLPVESFDKYTDWLQGAVLQSFRGTLRMLDEATACILGYDTHVREGQVYVVFDFGGGTLDVSVVRTRDLSAGDTRPCDVLGRAGEEIGGSLVDQWLLRELQQAQQLSDQDVADVGTALLRAVEDAKVDLSGGSERCEVEQFNDLSGRLISHSYTAGGLRRTLEAARPEFGGLSLYRLVASTVERALEQAQGRYGTRKSEVRAVFMAGGSSLLLGVAARVGDIFPNCPVHCEDPFEAIARGACRYAGEDINLALVHDYCLRAWDRDSKDYVLVPVVPRGTRYPTEKPVSVKYVNAACEGATRLGLVVVERSAMLRPETIYVMEGGSLKAVNVQRREDTSLRELNPGDTEFIHAEPACTIGERRFVAGFGVDANKRLTLSLKDLHAGNRSFVQLGNGERLDLPVRDLPFVKL
ncbi:Hsp70 family protein [Accumulibacter sp.]|uniref:Hsp70 family protein n=1 Tax=Accumulibacter sp. TaxID=2053492 RepID=UPI0025F9BC4E|nr:Hsp70 family protein [Accumulibacter sp.]MCM8594259.1 Hsp70 family protein [Accumulibacter sp.]MCM8626286.1 Hsp70 family protein [Accumulibacter sp.]MDS4048403.1 Hsp70 family protein [Accumulibacter sp.]